MARFLVWATGLFFLAYGLAFALSPLGMLVLVTGDYPEATSGVIDVRATYGGLSVAVGITMIAMGWRRETLRHGLAFTALVLLSMAAGRILGIVLDGDANVIMYLFLVAELLVGGVALLLRPSVD